MISPKLVPIAQKGFAKTSKALLGRAFHGLWFDTDSSFGPSKSLDHKGPVFFYSTHSSWWDPMVAAVIAVEIFGRRTLAPMAEREFKNYKSLRYVGVFGVSSGDGPACEEIFRAEISKEPETAIWVTPQGIFWPNEIDQPDFKSGLSRWSIREAALRIPVSIHYHFGALPKPGIFVRLGEGVFPKESHIRDFQKKNRDSEILEIDSRDLSKKLSQQNHELLSRVYEVHKGGFRGQEKFRKFDLGIL